MSRLLKIPVTAGVLLAAGCTMWFGPEERMQPEMPDAYRAAAGETAPVHDWWTVFGEEQLNGLIRQALNGNLTVEQAAARLRQSEASALQSGAARFPSLTGTAEAGTTERRSPEAGRVTADDFSLGLAASYELDLWGRVAAGHRAARQALEASRLNLETAAMTVAAETASVYFRWQALNGQLAVLNEQLDTNRKILSVIEKRFQTASADALDVLQQRQQVAAAESAIPPVRAALESAYIELCILTGVPPQAGPELHASDLPDLPARPDAGIPADLLANRPDLRAEWAQLAAADWNVSAARAARMPSITLTGAAAYQDDSTAGLFDNWVKNLAAGLALPLIDGGRRRAEVVRARAAADEQLSAYRAAVLSALGEVDDALSAENRQAEYLERLQAQLKATERTAQEAFRRYTRGSESYFEVLSAEIARQRLEVGVLNAERDLLIGRVRLYRVLGGDWTTVLEDYRNNEAGAE